MSDDPADMTWGDGVTWTKAWVYDDQPLPQSWWRRLLHLKPRYSPPVVLDLKAVPDADSGAPGTDPLER